MLLAEGVKRSGAVSTVDGKYLCKFAEVLGLYLEKAKEILNGQ
jgi:hypothetical protein